MGDGITNAGISDALDRSGEITNFACTKHTIREDRLRTLTAQALGVAAEDLTRGLLFARVEEICVQEGGEIAVHPLQTGGE